MLGMKSSFFVGFYLLQDVAGKSTLRISESGNRRLSSVNNRQYDVSYVSQASYVILFFQLTCRMGRFFYLPYLSKRWTG